MDEPNQNQTLQLVDTISKERILALSWKIATEPILYRELVHNPYSHDTLALVSKKFPDMSISDCIKAIILAEPEGKYEQDFSLLNATEQKEALQRQKNRDVEVKKRFHHYCKKHKKELSHLPKDVVYSILSLNIFETANTKEIERKYAQNQRKELRLAIITFIEALHAKSSKKPSRKKPLLFTAFAVPSLILLIYITHQQISNTVPHIQTKRQILGAQVQDKNQGFPMRLKIPGINVDAAVEYVGVTAKGAMDVPINTIDVGLFKFGAYPGETGSAVIAGHYDGATGEPGVFANLNELKKGDKVYINYANGISLVYVVRESRLYDPGFAKDVFNGSSGNHLNLVTCDGVWDAHKKSYSKRLVVFTDISH